MRPPEELRRELVRQWLTKAEEDYGLAQHLLNDKSVFLGAIAFHSQQAAEKYLKAFLTWHQVEFPKTHDLGDLLDRIGNLDPDLAEGLRGITFLNPYGVEVRYPGDFPELTTDEAQRAVEFASKTRQAALASLGEPFFTCPPTLDPPMPDGG